MPITTTQLGKQENVLDIEFGTGDIEFTKVVEDGEQYESALVFRQVAIPREIGEGSSDHAGKSTDEIEGIKMIMSFRKPESITALVHSLMELQKEVFKLNKVQEVQVSDTTKA